MAPPYPGAGPGRQWNDPNRNIADLSRGGNTATGPAYMAGMFGSKNVDTGGLDDIKSKFGDIVKQVGKLDEALKHLKDTVCTLATAMGRAGLGGGQAKQTGNMTFGTVTAATVSGGLARAGTSPNMSGAPVTGGPGGGLITSAPVSGGGGGGGGRLIAAAAIGGLAAQYGAQAQANTGILGGGTGIDLAASQANQIFNRGILNAGQAAQGYQFASMSQQDRLQAMNIMQANPFLFAGPGSRNQRGLNNFVNQMNRLNPAMGATGAAQFANLLASPAIMQALTRYGGAAGQAQGLYNPRTRQINQNSNQVMGGLLRLITRQPNLTGAQARNLSQNPGQWAALMQNAQFMGVNLSTPEQVAMREFAAGGMNIDRAAGGVAKTPAEKILGTQTAATNSKQNQFEAARGTQDFIQTLERDFHRAIGVFVNNIPGKQLAAFGTALGAAAGALGKLGGVLSDIYLTYKAFHWIFKGRKGEPGVPGGGGGGGGIANTVNLSESTIEQLCGCMGGGNPVKEPKPVHAPSGSWLKSLWGVGLGAIGVGLAAGKGAIGLGRKVLGGIGRGAEKVKNWKIPGIPEWKPPVPEAPLGPVDVPIAPVGDPTGETSTYGLKPGLSARVSAMMAANPSLRITSGRRSTAQQQLLYGLKGGRGVAKPGMSKHQTGEAVDIGPRSQFRWIARNARRFGLSRPAPMSEPWHLQMGDPVHSPVGPGLTQNRTDQGVDWGGSGPIYAVGAGTIINTTANNPGGWGSVYIVLKLDNPPDAVHSMVYYAENITPSVSVGQHVTAGQVIGQAHGGIEIGWASSTMHVALGSSEFTGSNATTAGKNFLAYIQGAATGGGAGATGTAGTGTSSPSPVGNVMQRTPGVSIGLTNTFLQQVKALGSGFGGGGGVMPSRSTTANNAQASTTTSSGSSNSAGAAGAAPSGNLTASQVYQLAINAGLSPAAARTAVAVASVESGFRTNATNVNTNGTTDFGLWQQNSAYGGSAALFNAAAAAAMMAQKSSMGTNWASWGPDFGSSNYQVNPPPGGAPGSKIARAMASLGNLGDPVGGGDFSSSFMSSGGMRGANVSFRSGGGGGGSSRPINVHMPIQVVGVSQQDAQNLAQMVVNQIRMTDAASSISGG